MRSLLTSILLVFGLAAMAQDSVQPAYEQAIQDRQSLRQGFTEAKASVDTANTALVMFISSVEPLLIADDQLIDSALTKEAQRADAAEAKVAGLNTELLAAKTESTGASLLFMIAAGGAGLFFLLFIVMLIMFISKGSKAKKMSKELAGKDEEMAAKEAALAEAEKTLKDQMAQLKKELDASKAAADLDKRNFRMKEDEYTAQVKGIEERIKKATQKESDLNYQVFQLELKLKNELEGTVREKCALENKVVELERELSEARMNLAEAKNQPQTHPEEIESLQRELDEAKKRISELSEQTAPLADNAEIEDLRGKVSWYENEAVYLRQCIDNERIAKEKAESALNNTGGSDTDELIRNLYMQIDELRPRAEEADQLRTQLNEMIQFMDRFRQGQ